jgi:hypothetical protein
MSSPKTNPVRVCEGTFLVATFHGGYCCGITHISGFIHDPALTLAARSAVTDAMRGNNPGYYSRVYGGYARPQETAEERLKALVAQIIEQRSKGIIECVLTDTQLYNGKWQPVLEKIGFRFVNKAKNSNSNRTLHVFHYNTGEET